MEELRERMARIEGAFEQMNARLNHIESEIRELRGDIKTLYRTMLAILIPMWVTIIAAIITAGLLK